MADPNNPWGQTTDDPWTGEGTVAWTDSKQQPQSQSADRWGQSPDDSDWGEPDQAKQASQDAAWGQPADKPEAAWDNPATDARWDGPADSKQDSQQDTSPNQEKETTGWGQANSDWNTPTDDDQWGNPSTPDDNQWEEEDPNSQWGETAEQTMPAATPDNQPNGKRKHEPRKPIGRKKLVAIIIGVLILVLAVILCHGRSTGTTANDWQEEWSSLAQQADHMADTADQSNQQARNMVTDIKTTADTHPNGFTQYVVQAGRLEGDMSVLRSLQTQPAQTVGQTQTALTQALTPALTAVQQHAGAPSADPLKQLVSQWAAQTITSSNQTQAQQAITRIQQLTQQVDQNK